MTDSIRKQIAEAIVDKVQVLKLSGNQAAAKMGVCAATYSKMINCKWENISDEMWRKAGVWAGYNPGWQTVNLPNYRRIVNYCIEAQKMSKALVMSYEPGCGKSHALKSYAWRTAGSLYVECEHHYTEKLLMQKLLQQTGVSTIGTKVELIERVIEELNRMERPLVILDEFDKLNDKPRELFNTLYNKTVGRCGFVLAGATTLREKLEAGVKKNNLGYREMLSRLGYVFCELRPISVEDVTALCLANGIEEQPQIEQIIRETRTILSQSKQSPALCLRVAGRQIERELLERRRQAQTSTVKEVVNG